MLDQNTKRKIDSVRQILVGKVPDPKAQVEQITIALIYKFMDDMDKESEELGGDAKFFANGFSKYAWTKLLDQKLSGQERLDLYTQSISSLSRNQNIPQLFRDIFKGAFLPYNDPRTLSLFLKEINEFTYEHSEDLGDAFEYLLSVLGSQGDAGQFRTPRHIIDFMVAVMDPKKNEKILDPACGTAGFLISAYKHILNTNKNKPLSPDEKLKLMNNLTGYDISPDMVKLALVNMYLHGFPEPKIHEYDTLSDEKRWDENADVILANPPFMSPKGGIQPHKRFSVQSNRSEVLFVDYMAEHLTLNGRAGIIVPEGIIFQSAGAYKQLRKYLIENDYLYAVVSLPAGVFNPYSGVKTSILFLDRMLAKKTDKILFAKVEADGLDLGAQRKEIEKDDLPHTLELLHQYKIALQGNKEFKSEYENVFLVEKKKIAGKEDYNLSIDRYRELGNAKQSHFEMVAISEICEIQRGGSPRPIEVYITDDQEGINWIKIGDVSENAKYVLKTKEKIKKEGLKKTRMVYDGDFILSNSMSFGRPYIVKITGAIHDGWLLLRMKDKERINQDYLYEVLRSDLTKEQYERLATGGVVRNLNSELVRGVQIPLPPLNIQNEIVSKIKTYQTIINGAKEVVENYKPEFEIKEDWEMVELGSVCNKITDGSHFSPPTVANGYPYVTVKDIVGDQIDFNNCKFISKEYYDELLKNDCNPLKNDILFSKDGTVGKVSLVDFEREFVVLSSLAIIRPNTKIVDPNFLKIVLQSEYFLNSAIENKTGVAIKRIVLKTLKTIHVPIPTIKEQKEIVNRIKSEIILINGCNELISLYEQKIKDEINKLWQD